MHRQTETETNQIPAAGPYDGSIDNATLQLLANWRLRDATDNVEEIRDAELELAEFKSAMNRNRISTGDPVVYP